MIWTKVIDCVENLFSFIYLIYIPVYIFQSYLTWLVLIVSKIKGSDKGLKRTKSWNGQMLKNSESNKLLSPAYFCVNHNYVSTLAFNIYFFKFPWSLYHPVHGHAQDGTSAWLPCTGWYNGKGNSSRDKKKGYVKICLSIISLMFKFYKLFNIGIRLCAVF